MIINHPASGNKIPGIFEGKVVKHDFSMYMGVKIWVPGLHAEEYLLEENIDKLPTARAAAPLFGNCDGDSGMFACPDIGTLVYCFCIDGDPNTIVYFAADYEKSLNAKLSYPALKLKYTEKDCAWMKQGPGQIVLRTPPTLSPAEEDKNNEEYDPTLTRAKVVEIFSGQDQDSGNRDVASICIFSNNDIEIKGANIKIEATKSIDMTLPADEEAHKASITSWIFEDPSDNALQITMADGMITMKGRVVEIYAKIFNIVASVLRMFCFEKVYYSLKQAIGIVAGVNVNRKRSS